MSENATVLLRAWQQGDQFALNELITLLTPELRRSAIAIARPNQHLYQLQPTELINEAMIRLLDVDNIDWQDRAHFLAIAAITMRRVLVEEARKFHAAKRSRIDVTLNESVLSDESLSRNVDVLAVDEALTALHELFPDRSRIVQLKFFAGMTNEEIAAVENLSLSKVKRLWRSARVWIINYIEDEAGPQSQK